MKTSPAIFSILCCAASQVGAVTLFSPSGATASTQFSNLYDIGNAIDGSGLPVNFDENSVHADYATNNHWTTASNQVPGASATFTFDSPVTIATVALWNHRSNVIASNPNYEVTNFTIEFLDSTNGSLFSAAYAAAGETASAQLYSFPFINNVSSVVFTINDNQGVSAGNNPNYSGIAEIAFSSEAVPEPTSALLASLGALGLLCRRRPQ